MTIYKGTSLVAGVPDLNNYALDSNVVHKTGNENIIGVKRFISPLFLGNESSNLGSIEMFGGNTSFGGFIDFHYGNSTSDYTSRIIEDDQGVLSFDCNRVMAPASDINGSILTTLSKSKGDLGYFKLGNGLIIQWGSFNRPSNSSYTINFPVAFSDVGYKIVATPIDGTNQNSYAPIITNQASTTATVFLASPLTYVGWIAVGY